MGDRGSHDGFGDWWQRTMDAVRKSPSHIELHIAAVAY
jgi:hypothetical protein